MGDGNTILKVIITIFVLANLVMLGINGMTYWDREVTREKEVSKAKKNTARIRELSLGYLADVDRIDRGNFRKVDRESVYFEECLNTVGLNPTTDSIQIPITPRVTNGKKYQEEEWKLQFASRDRRFSLKDLCRLCDQIETLTPGFQIKEADFGKRSETWGTDSWKPSYISVRRISTKPKK